MVLSIILLAAGMVVPGVAALFTAGAESQAYNVMAGLLAGARAYAIQNATYAGVHVQLGDGSAGLANTCWAAVVALDPNDPNMFRLADGFSPQRMPGSVAMGELKDEFVSGNSYQNLADDQIGDFTTFTVVFSPDGAIVGKVGDKQIVCAKVQDLWSDFDPDAEEGAAAVTIFDYDEFRARTTAQERADYLNANGRFLPINRYTGLPLER